MLQYPTYNEIKKTAKKYFNHFTGIETRTWLFYLVKAKVLKVLVSQIASLGDQMRCPALYRELKRDINFPTANQIMTKK